jgi:hypothetical protein
MAMSADNFLKQRGNGTAAAVICACGCGKPLGTDDLDLRKTIDGRLVRADCWYEAIGAHVEKNPIHTPGIRRG